MYNDPNQPQQPPYGQAQPSYGQPQPPYAVPPLSGPAPQPRRKGRPVLWIVLGILGVLLLACIISIFVGINLFSHNGATVAVNNYYTAIKSQDYATAFRYLDPNMKLTAQGGSQQITQDLYTQAAQGFDTAKGKVSNYSITSTSLNSNNGVNTASLTVNVTRGSTSYDVNLQLQQEGNDWKIISFDNI